MLLLGWQKRVGSGKKTAASKKGFCHPMALKKRKVQGIWSSRWTFLAAATALAMGLGDYWRTPFEMGEYGGGLYLLAYCGFLLLVMLPVAVAEVRIAVRGRANPVHSVDQLVHFAKASRHWVLLPQMAAVAALLLAANYSVVAGWLLAYIPKLPAEHMAAASLETVADEFQMLMSSPEQMRFWQRVFIAAAVALSSLSVIRGMAVALRVLLPVMIIALLFVVYYAYSLGDFAGALSWLFDFRWDDFGWQGVFSALRQSFYTLSIATGALMAYGAYFPSGRSVSRQLFSLAFLDTALMLLGGFAVLALVLDQHIVAGPGPSLLFISLPYTFVNLAFGDIFGVATYLMLSILALTTVVALLEPSVAYLVERWRLSRWAAALCAGSVLLLLGDISISSLAPDSELQWASLSFMEYLDIVAAHILLPLCGFCFVMFAAWRVPKRVYGVRDHWLDNGFFWLWQALLRYIAPPALLAVLVVGLYQRVA
ncbi:sodium-dependent transporter [Spongiibacter sp. IMCC21906]|jgi:NSS family neurotransmitter:Na+ symporter|uniref:sodium-dependent transporter n=1 Tax=Spongiibacter sp. IMCC21906 TaxID=1620392 RepID=UPI00069B9E09|nr:sodium-dependent transporter [Spongiibacter sp. IMCC21906]